MDGKGKMEKNMRQGGIEPPAQLIHSSLVWQSCILPLNHWRVGRDACKLCVYNRSIDICQSRFVFNQSDRRPSMREIDENSPLPMLGIVLDAMSYYDVPSFFSFDSASLVSRFSCVLSALPFGASYSSTNCCSNSRCRFVNERGIVTSNCTMRSPSVS